MDQRGWGQGMIGFQRAAGGAPPGAGPHTAAISRLSAARYPAPTPRASPSHRCRESRVPAGRFYPFNCHEPVLRDSPLLVAHRSVRLQEDRHANNEHGSHGRADHGLAATAATTRAGGQGYEPTPVHCSVKTLRGAYGVQWIGTRPYPNLRAHPRSSRPLPIAIQTFDGAGNFTQVSNVKGAVAGLEPENIESFGTYEVMKTAPEQRHRSSFPAHRSSPPVRDCGRW
jgi:hypothetical protein